MQALLKARKIKIEPYGPPSNETERLVRNRQLRRRHNDLFPNLDGR